MTKLMKGAFIFYKMQVIVYAVLYNRYLGVYFWNDLI